MIINASRMFVVFCNIRQARAAWQADHEAYPTAATLRVAPSMNAQNAANALWALATLGWDDHRIALK